MNDIRQRIKSLRLELLRRDLDALYISGTDPHASEYLAPHWQIRSFISGFTGSYGVVIITHEEAGLWTDPRYFLQAVKQLKGSGMRMYKLRVPDAVSPESWLSKRLSSGSKVGFEPQTVPVSSYRHLNFILSRAGIILVETPGIFDKIWEDRPQIPTNRIFELATSYAGVSRHEKREMVLTELKKHRAGMQVVSKTDELAWLFNLRGSDVPYNPVFTGYGVVDKNESILFINRVKLPAEICAGLEKGKIRIAEYDEFYAWLGSLKNKTVFIDPATANFEVYRSLNSDNKIVEGISVIALLKAQKNQIELEGFRKAMEKDGVALVEFLFWLKNNVGNEVITEYTAGYKLTEFRSMQEDFMGESFPPIVGYKEHGAVIHLNVEQGDALPINEEGILLFDSGGHYLHGTTDITRTIALGKPTKRQKIDYTLVLKGMIALTMARFPEGTKGCNLDILARKALWEQGLNYGHGTGHGVGHFLNVHEGPMAIRQELNEVSIQPGMVISNEPGLYREGEYGIRIENMMVCTEREETRFGNFMGFETLTLCPIDISLIDINQLTQREKDWINIYHRKVRNEIKPLLRKELCSFFDGLTAKI